MEDTNLENHFEMKLDLNDQELIDVKEFLKAAQSLSLDIENMDIAVKFLRAKKFNIDAALDLYTKHQAVRVKENLNEINPFQSDIFNELLSRKFTFLLNCDRTSGASICIFTVKLHLPSKTTHQNVLKALIFQLDAALTIPSVQRNGIIFVYDMNGSLYSNFDIQLSVKILNLLKGAYPARLCKVIIFTPPLWFRASFNFLRLFVREKLRDRIFIVTKDEELHRYITKDVLPRDLGGLVDHNHSKWLSKAFVSLGYSDLTLSQFVTNHNVDVPINNLKSQDHKFFPNNYQTHPSSEIDDDNLTSVNGELLSPVSAIPGLHEKSTTSSSSGVASLDYNASPHPMVTNDERHSSPDDSSESSSGQDCRMVGNTSSDYEMISVSSWDINLSVSGDENVMESEEDLRTNENRGEEEHGVKSEASTVENSPNIVCCSAKTPVKSLEESMFFRKQFVKRRNAVRHDSKLTNKMPSWALYRPDGEPCLHNRLSPDVTDCDESERGMSIEYFAESSDHNVFATMNEFRIETIYGNVPQFTSYTNPINAVKNRYSDIPCIEESRVKLVRDLLPSNERCHDNQLVTSLKPNDYIHANWVDGYRQKNAFICAQGPLSTTVSDFWHMVIQYRSPIIVMTTRPREQNRDKCYQYWPENVGERKIITGINDLYDSFEVTSLRSKEFGPNCPKNGVCDPYNEHWYRVALLHVKNCRTGQEHRVNHFYFHSWPDQGIPHSSEGFLHFILQIRQTYRFNIAKLDYESEMDQPIPPPPIVVHCSAGIGRTGTYIVTEICSKSLTDCGRFNLHQTMLKVRSQRYKCVQNSYQYLYCRNTIIDYAKQFGMLEIHNDNSVEEEEEGEEEEEFNEPIEEASESD